ncbi:O-phospho-L-serine:2-oxoglutarate aminotransferase [Aureococcus anophagefferens]|nr:O-phospho-L-serine:2-oxoglutarate aminotransferase [Aureococcus anophagefferens]
MEAAPPKPTMDDATRARIAANKAAALKKLAERKRKAEERKRKTAEAAEPQCEPEWTDEPLMEDDCRLGFGKHAEKTASWVYENEEDYAQWVTCSMLAIRQSLARRSLAPSARALSAAAVEEPLAKPDSPNFSSGPCAKRPGWSPAVYGSAPVGRSHRSSIGKARLKEAIEKTRSVLGVPDDYRIGVVPASDTGAIEMAMWSMLGERPVDVCHWESFGKTWFGDVTNQLKLADVTDASSPTSPTGPLPKIFQLAKKGKVDEALFTGATINTPSMICVEDYLDALTWAESIGGLEGLKKRSEANLAAVANWVDATPWAHFLAKDPKTRSNTSVCLTLDTAPDNVKKMTKYLEDAHVAYDIGAYRDAPPGLRIWCGATVETSDVEALLPWIEHAYAKVN